MARIGLIDVDGHNFPNLALMKISAYHKSIGDTVEWWWGWDHYDKVYMSKVFDETYSEDLPDPANADVVVRGGTGYGLDNKLPYEIEHMMPDYSIYPEQTKDTAYGFLTRGCPNNCGFCIVSCKEGRKSVKVADLTEWWTGQKNIVLMDPNLLACRDRVDLLQQLIDSKAWVDVNQGFDACFLTEEIIGMINRIKLKEIHFAWDTMEKEQRVLAGLDLYKSLATRKPNGAWGTVYTLTNYNTTHDEDLYRIEVLRARGYDPYVMIYDKPNAPKITKMMQRWCNNRRIFKACPNFADYLKKEAEG